MSLSSAALRELDRCNKCGFCLPTCPTYVRLELEPASPRGRLAIAEEVAAGRQSLDPYVAEQMYLCLGCRACETACPSGVQFGIVLEDMRGELQRAGVPAPGHDGMADFVLDHVITHPGRLRWLRRLLRWYQRAVQPWLRRAKLLPRKLASLESGIPGYDEAPAVTNDPAPDVAFFRGCLMDVLYEATNNRSVHVLKAMGHRVACPAGEVCCGALHGHAGRLDEARALARQNIAAFEATGADMYVNAAGGCGAFMQGYGHLLEDDPEWAEKARKFSHNMVDLSVAAHDLKVTATGVAVTLQDSCHLRHGQKVAREPRDLLKRLGRLAELPGADTCCGSAGLYSLTHRAMSSRVLADKMAAVADIAADVLVTANPGCQMQMQAGVAQAGLNVKVVHLADLLYTSYVRPSTTGSQGPE